MPNSVTQYLFYLINNRAAFMCGREPNFELTEEEKEELRRYTWEAFLEMTRNNINNKSKISCFGKFDYMPM